MVFDGVLGGARRWWRRKAFWGRGRESPYDRETVQVMERLLSLDACCVDVGANLGDILEAMVRVAPRGRHHAFEPIPRLASRLRRCFPEVAVHEVALRDRPGRAEFLHVVNDPGYSGLQRREYDRPDPRIVPIQVETATLDDVLPPELPVAFVKLDIEGGEYHALLGADRTLRRWRPTLVFEAGAKSSGRYGVTPGQMYDLLGGHGYRITTMRRWLDGGAPLDAEAFAQNWAWGPDYCFLAEPVPPVSAEAGDAAARTSTPPPAPPRSPPASR